METKMNPEVKAKWLAALRGGVYPQGKNELKTSDGAYCCLGVLCDLHQQDKQQFTWTKEGSYIGKGLDLPHDVSTWAGIDGKDIKLGVEILPEAYRYMGAQFGRNWVWISQLNDAGMPFTEIAALISKNL